MNAEVETPAATLSEETRLTKQLIELLKQEQAHLIKADIEGLMAITEEKARAANEMNELARRRYRNLAAIGYAPAEGGMRTWLDDAAPDAIANAWDSLLTLAQSAKSLNSTNGLLIGKHMSRNQQALNILRGNQGNSFYGPNGQATSSVRSRGLVIG
jgi:flagella synthesis protein FlgN